MKKTVTPSHHKPGDQELEKTPNLFRKEVQREQRNPEMPVLCSNKTTAGKASSNLPFLPSEVPDFPSFPSAKEALPRHLISSQNMVP